MEREAIELSLVVPVSDGDWMAGPADAPVTLVEYSDFECSDAARLEPMVQEVRRLTGDELRFVYRHLPLSRKHPNAVQAAEASEAAGRQGQFWAMHDLLIAHYDQLTRPDLLRYAVEVGLDVTAFQQALEERTYQPDVREDFVGGVQSGADGTPTFYVNGVRYDDWYETPAFLRAVRDAVAAARQDGRGGKSPG
jgi:protein-disulfide isomerase